LPLPAVELGVAGLRARRRAGSWALAAAFGWATLLAGCDRFSHELEPGSYRATLTVGGGELPFGLDVAREEQGFVLYLVNGEERVRVPARVGDDGALTATVPGYETTLRAQVRGKKLQGEVTMTGGGGATQTLPFAATLGPTWRFYATAATDNADVDGRWDITYTTDDGRRLHGVAELQQRFEQVSGTVLLATGDQRYLAGEVHGDELRLSRFDGGSAYLYHARVDAKGRLVGDYWSGKTGHRRFVAVRNADAELDRDAVTTGLRDPSSRFAFTFPSLDRKPVSLADPEFAGNVVIVAISGSWCPNCHDEARLLMALQTKYAARGLRVVSLMFENYGDFERAAAAARKYRDALGITYPTLIAGISENDDAGAKLPQLTGVFAFPTTLFVDRSGQVRKIHAGFAGPATGQHYEALAFEWTALVERLLAEPAVSP
jgi:thiol-disulfide isomerase/thioredoxin